jgi:3',5'-cyclic AMP phosphodiesterase CpdA
VGALLCLALLGAPRAAAAAAAPDGISFVHVSDVHAWNDPRDFGDYSMPIPAWIPGPVANWLILWQLARYHPTLDRAGIAAAFRRELAAYGVARAGELGDLAVLSEWAAELRRPGSELGRVAERLRAALAEIEALRPDFVLSTGDLVLEGNTAPPEVMERWLRFYRDETAATGIPFHHTIGNNELAGIASDDFPTDDPRYAKGAFRALFGPTWFSFDRGPFHFVALDTHAPEPGAGDPRAWSFSRMPEEERAWLDADLARSRGRSVVALNHEPFAADPRWKFAGALEPADDDGLFAKHAVAYALAGHVHWNGFVRVGATTHITTGALSGLRWAAPESVTPRGYRLFWGTPDGALYSAWKETGQPVLELVQPSGDSQRFTNPGADPTRAAASDGRIAIVAVAADAGGPFASVRLLQDGKPLPVERWGAWFFAASAGPGVVDLVATDARGRTLRVRRVRVGEPPA